MEALWSGEKLPLRTPREPALVWCQRNERAWHVWDGADDFRLRACVVRPHPPYDPRSYRKPRPQIKDLDTFEILAHLAKRVQRTPGWTTRIPMERANWCCHWQAIKYRDPGTKVSDQGMGEALLFAKLRTLTFKGLIDGCLRGGGRGDWVITNKGLERLFALAKAKAS